MLSLRDLLNANNDLTELRLTAAERAKRDRDMLKSFHFNEVLCRSKSLLMKSHALQDRLTVCLER